MMARRNSKRPARKPATPSTVEKTEAVDTEVEDVVTEVKKAPAKKSPAAKSSSGASALRDATASTRRRSSTAVKTTKKKESADEADSSGKVPRHDQMTLKHSLAHRLYTGETSYDFMRNRKKWYLVSGVILLICILSLGIRGLNLGIEFKGGTVFTVPVTVTDSIPNDLGAVVEDTGLPELDGTSVVTVGNHTARVQTRTMTTEEVTTVRTALAQHVGASAEGIAYSTVGASWGAQITEKGIQALVVFIVLVGLMIWAYFRDWKMSVAALVALLHDLVLTVGIYSLLGFSVSPSTLIGVLTILGYSLYDTVVVFDKVRENVKGIAKQKHTYAEQANLAINQVLVRSINTTIIGVLPVAAILVAALFFMGPGPLEDLGLALFIGMIAGAYSSVFIAAPLLAQLRERDPEMVKHREKLGRRTERHARGSMDSIAEVAEDDSQEQGSSVPSGGPEVIVNEVGDDPWELEGVEVEDPDLDEAPEDDDEPAPATRPQPRRQSRGRRRN